MRKILLLVTGFSAIYTSCGLDCVDKKTGMHKSSHTLKEAQSNKLFQFELSANKSLFHLDSGVIFRIKNAWVENSWRYECIAGKAAVVKDSIYQFVIDATYQSDAALPHYWLENNRVDGILDYNYSGQDTIRLSLYKDTSYSSTNNKTLEGIITFVKR